MKLKVTVAIRWDKTQNDDLIRNLFKIPVLKTWRTYHYVISEWILEFVQVTLICWIIDLSAGYAKQVELTFKVEFVILFTPFHMFLKYSKVMFKCR